MTKSQARTLGQKIDAVLEPLYEEAEQHRATIALMREQQAKLQQQVDAAEEGLSKIESRMAEVVRAMAQEEPVIAAVVGGSAQAPAIPQPTETIDAAAATEPVVEDEPAVEIAEAPEPEATFVEDAAPVADEATEEATEEAEPEAMPEAATQVVEEPGSEQDEQETPTIELDPVADAAAVDEAAAMLDALPEPTPEPEPEPAKIDLTAAAERAAAAAKLLREKAGTK